MCHCVCDLLSLMLEDSGDVYECCLMCVEDPWAWVWMGNIECQAVRMIAFTPLDFSSGAVVSDGSTSSGRGARILDSVGCRWRSRWLTLGMIETGVLEV
jgi:hypothetical protein